jgi:CRP-like cAMP-binding protein
MPIAAEQLDTLLQNPLFKRLTRKEAQDFFDVAVEVSLGKGEVLFKEGEVGDALLVVIAGDVAITRRGVELATLGAGSVLGEMAVVGPDDKRSATATAKSGVTVLKLPAKRVQQLLSEHHVAALKVATSVAEVMARRLAAINDKLVEATDKGNRHEELSEFGRILNDWSF